MIIETNVTYKNAMSNDIIVDRRGKLLKLKVECKKEDICRASHRVKVKRVTPIISFHTLKRGEKVQKRERERGERENDLSIHEPSLVAG